MYLLLFVAILLTTDGIDIPREIVYGKLSPVYTLFIPMYKQCFILPYYNDNEEDVCVKI